MYIEKFKKNSNKEGLSPCIKITGKKLRFSDTEDNLQNIPSKNEVIRVCNGGYTEDTLMSEWEIFKILSFQDVKSLLSLAPKC